MFLKHAGTLPGRKTPGRLNDLHSSTLAGGRFLSLWVGGLMKGKRRGVGEVVGLQLRSCVASVLTCW